MENELYEHDREKPKSPNKKKKNKSYKDWETDNQKELEMYYNNYDY